MHRLLSGEQLGFSDCELATAKMHAKREKFTSQMEVIVPWQALLNLIGLSTQKTVEEALTEEETMRHFVGM